MRWSRDTFLIKLQLYPRIFRPFYGPAGVLYQSIQNKDTECEHQKILEEYVRKVRSSLKKLSLMKTCVTTVFIFASRVASKQSLSIQSTEFVQILRNTTNLCNLKLDEKRPL